MTEDAIIAHLDRRAQFRRWARHVLSGGGNDYEFVALLRWSKGLGPMEGKWWT